MFKIGRHVLPVLGWMCLVCNTLADPLEEITIGLEDIDYFPIIVNSENGPKGYLAELLDMIENTGRFSIALDFMPIARLKHLLSDGGIDVKYPDNPYWILEDAPARYFSVAIVQYQDGLIFLDEVPESLYEVGSIGTLYGFTVVAKKYWNTQATIEYAESIQSLFRMLSTNRVQAIYFNYDIALNTVPSELSPRMRLADQFKTDVGYFYFSTLSSRSFIEEINRYIGENPDIIKRLKRKYRLN